jgi:hypothetical protein
MKFISKQYIFMEVVNATYQSLHTLITNKLQAVRTKKLAHNKITLSKNRKKNHRKSKFIVSGTPYCIGIVATIYFSSYIFASCDGVQMM